MGKLHTLRRAIERDPKQWDRTSGIAMGAWRRKRDGAWFPSWSGGYNAFVRSVIKELRR